MPRQIGQSREEIMLYELYKQIQLIKAGSSGGGGGAVNSVNGQTGSVSLDTGDIASVLNSRYVTDAMLAVLGNTSGTNTGDQTLSDATLALTDILTNNASAARHGFLPKLPDLSYLYLNGKGNYVDPTFRAIQRDLGWTGGTVATLGRTILDVTSSTGAAGFADSRMILTAFRLPEATTISNVQFVQSIQGNYVGDNYNGIGIYSYSAGVLTLVASTTNDTEFWKGATNTLITKALSSPYAAAAGTYMLAVLYNNSSQTTLPQIGTYTALQANTIPTLGYTNSARFHGYLISQTSLPSSINMSSLTAGNIPIYAELY